MSSEGTTPMTTHHDADIAPELGPLGLEDKPDGPAAAMLISAGIGVLVLGVMTLWVEASTGMNTALGKWDFGTGVGALAGKTIIASIAYFGSLLVLWLLWRDKDVDLKRSFYTGCGLGLAGAVLTFPTFFQLFAPA
jgi:hypothetical protein